MQSIEARIASTLGVRENQVAAAVALLDEGSTVPFIARYRKEVTGGLDDTQLRNLEERLRYLREMDDRRDAILKSIDEQGKLSPDLKKAIVDAQTKTELEDLYLPYKPKRRTKAQIAREAGLEPLAHDLLANPDLDPQNEAARYINADKGVTDAAAALDGARQILMEEFAEQAPLLAKLRNRMWQEGVVSASVVPGKEAEGAKFSDYFNYQEAIRLIPSHRALALFRGRNEGVLNINLDLPEVAVGVPHPCEGMIADFYNLADKGRPADRWLLDTVRWAWKVKIYTHIDLELKMQLKEAAENEAILVFGRNLKDLLLAAPAGNRATMGLDPGLRTGVKVAVVDSTGKLLDTATIYPHVPRNDWEGSISTLAVLCAKHKVELIAIGNGTASRETDKLAADLIKRYPQLGATKIMVSEAGASVYSASELAAKEFPNLDVSLRGAVSIARRLQDPLAELVKIEPKAIGVGQYQHDVNQTQLARTLGNVVEDCVNAVGVDLNMASAPLLSQVSGLSSTLASNIVEFRNSNGAFRNRRDLLKVPRLGEKAFEQAAGFLRIREGDNPLDASSVHPEAYPVVERILAKTGKSISELMGNSSVLKGINAADFTDEKFGLPTVRDIIAELDKPGRDPRPEFKAPEFQEGVEDITDLRPGMILEGAVTNVTNFGAFVDIGVHQDGLVHVSAMSEKFIRDPAEVVKAGDIVKVKVMEVDVARKRIGLSMRMSDEPGVTTSGAPVARGDSSNNRQRGNKQSAKPVQHSSGQISNNAMAAALANAFKK